MSELEIPLSRPDIGELEESMVLRTLRSGRLSIGPMVEQFEAAVATRVGRREAVAVNSGTSGLHLMMRALNIGPGDEVITTPFSFIASSNAILFVGATPKFVDIDPSTLNMDPTQVAEAITPRTKAILAVETFGNPSHMHEYESIAARHEIPLIEDCCEALGTQQRGRSAGSFGRISVFGFYPNKQITTGEGGMIVTDDQRLADLCRSMRNQGREIAPGGAVKGPWLQHARLGYNYRLAELNASLGVAQMKRLDEIITKREAVASAYIERLAGNANLIVPTCPSDARMSWFVFVVRLATTYSTDERDRVIDGLRRHDIGAADYFPCIHLQPFYQAEFGFRPGMFPIAERVSQRTIALPFFTSLRERDVDLVVQTLELMISRESFARR